ncbi:MAG: hypothetical protein NT077_02900 [Candidatus Taylorbacteria bacterium]|nr:hypothetical protein [Candidatus Taylorbacteria bacterium]
MSKRQILMILGVLTMITLRLGFPKDWDFVILLVIGLLIIIIAYSLKPGNGEEGSTRKEEPPYIDYHGPAGNGS